MQYKFILLRTLLFFFLLGVERYIAPYPFCWFLLIFYSLRGQSSAPFLILAGCLVDLFLHLPLGVTVACIAIVTPVLRIHLAARAMRVAFVFFLSAIITGVYFFFSAQMDMVVLLGSGLFGVVLYTAFSFPHEVQEIGNVKA